MAEVPPSDNVWVGDLPPDLTKDFLQKIFEAYGNVVDCRVLPPKQQGQNACAMVRFASLDESAWVVSNLNGNIPSGLGVPIVARFANNSSTASAGPKTWTSLGDAVATAGKPGAAGMKGGQQPAGRPSPYSGSEAPAGGGGAGWKKTKLCTYWSTKGDCNRGENCTFAHGEHELGTPQPTGGGGNGTAWTKAGGRSWAGGGAVHGGGYGHADAWGPPAGAWGGKGGKSGAPGSAQGLLTAVRKAGLLGGGRVPTECQLYVKNLPEDTTDLDLFRLFAPFGSIAPSGVKVMVNEDGSCKGFGFVDYVEEASASLAAATLNGFTCPDGGAIHVSTKLVKKVQAESL